MLNLWDAALRKLPCGTVVCIAAAGLFMFAASGAEAGGRLQVTPAHSECGEVLEGTPVKTEVILRNVGDGALAIKNLTTN